MRSPFIKLPVFAFCIAAWLYFPSSATAQIDQWQNLMHPNSKLKYFVVTRDRQCEMGSLSSVTDSSFTLTRRDKGPLIVGKNDLLEVRSGYVMPGPTIYSQRSSWLKVKNLSKKGMPHANVWVLMRDRSKRTGKVVSATDSSIVIRQGTNKIEVPRADISQAYQQTVRPMSGEAEYISEEAPFLDFFVPELWPYFFHAEGISVLLYNSQLLEDNSIIKCP